MQLGKKKWALLLLQLAPYRSAWIEYRLEEENRDRYVV